MRPRHLLAFGAALLAVLPAPVAGQGDPGCDFPESGTIDQQSWANIQAYLTEIDGLGAFDLHPWVSDRQSLVRGKGNNKQAGGMALVAGRPLAAAADVARLEAGCFVGMIHAEAAESDVGAFEGKTFVWVDKRGPGEAWRSIQFPLEEEGEAESSDVLRYMLPADSLMNPGGVAPPTTHYVYKGLLYRGALDAHPFDGARWILQPPWLLTPPPEVPFPWMLYAMGTFSYLEVMGCYRCDDTTCCPTMLTQAAW